MATVQRSFESAKQTAAAMANAELSAVGHACEAEPLSSFHMEAEGCWVFFLGEHLHLPAQPGTLLSKAYAVAKYGDLSAAVYDFRPNTEQMQAYVEAWSLYALGRREEANAAIDSFRKKYEMAGEA